MPHYGAFPDDWLNLDLSLGLTQDLLPVASNPNSPISPKSSLKQVGKVPSRYNSNRQITGISNWTQHKAEPKDIISWMKEDDYGICLITRRVRALDLDISDLDKAQTIVEFIGAHLNWLGLPIRSRQNSSKCLLAFELLGTFRKRVMKVDGGIIEFLGDGQQFVAFGTHPSGARYEWDWQDHKAFPVLEAQEFESLWKALTDSFALETPSESGIRNPTSQNAITALNDPVTDYLAKHGHITSIGRESQIFIRCPFSHEHSEPDAPDGTSTAYLPAGGRDYEQGHWRCLHAHCAYRDDAEFLDAIGYRAADFQIIPDDAPELQETFTSQDTLDKFAVIPAHEYIKRPRSEWIVKGVLPRAGLALMYGGSGDGKTFAAIDMMMSAARGIDWNGHRTKGVNRIVYVCAESMGGFIDRLKGYTHSHNVKLEDIPFGIIPAAPNFRKAEEVKRIANQVNIYGKVDIIVIDTLAQVTPGADENTSKDMSVVLRHCADLHQLTGALVLLVHHAGKDENRGARGWSGLKAPLDAEFRVSREGDVRKLWVEKMKEGRDGFGWNFKLNPIVIGLDSDGDPIDSCAVSYEGPIVSNKKINIRKRGFWITTALQVFDDLGGVSELAEAIINETVNRSPGTEEIRKKKHRAKRALEELAQEGEIKIDRGVVTRPL